MPAQHPCPVCGAGAATRRGLRTHLMVEHRKSELARLLVDVSDADRELDRLTA